MKSSKKLAVTPVGNRNYTVFEQRQPLRKEFAGGKVYYEPNIVRVGQIEAKSASDALIAAKKRGMTEKPLIWGEETEQMRDIYQQRKSSYYDD